MTLILMRTSDQVLLRIMNHKTYGISDFIYFDFAGAQIWNTQNPQPEVDYECGTHRLKVIGVDLT